MAGDLASRHGYDDVVPNPDERPRGLRFNDPTADIVWAAIQTLDEAAKHEVLTHLRDHLAIPDARRTDRGAQIAKAVAALREAAEILRARGDKSDLSTHRYEALRLELDRKGNWRRRARSAGSSPAPGTTRCDARSSIRSQSGTRSECSSAAGSRVKSARRRVRECSQETETPLPTYSHYIAWSRRPDVRRRPGRRPHAQSPFTRNFYRWADVLVAAGLAQEGEITGPVLRTPDASIRSTSGYRWADEQLADALREIAGRLGRSPNTSEYPRERERLLAEQQQRGEPARPFPSLPSILGRYRSWDAALTAADLEPTGGRRDPDGRRRRSTRRIPEEEVFACLREALEAVGHPFTTAAYTAWRKRQIAQDRRHGVLRRIPSYHAIHTGYGDWATACRRAIGDARR